MRVCKICGKPIEEHGKVGLLHPCIKKLYVEGIKKPG